MGLFTYDVSQKLRVQNSSPPMSPQNLKYAFVINIEGSNLLSQVCYFMCFDILDFHAGQAGEKEDWAYSVRQKKDWAPSV